MDHPNPKPWWIFEWDGPLFVVETFGKDPGWCVFHSISHSKQNSFWWCLSVNSAEWQYSEQNMCFTPSPTLKRGRCPTFNLSRLLHQDFLRRRSPHKPSNMLVFRMRWAQSFGVELFEKIAKSVFHFLTDFKTTVDPVRGTFNSSRFSAWGFCVRSTPNHQTLRFFEWEHSFRIETFRKNPSMCFTLSATLP